MIRRVFVDTDIILDVALARKPFVETSRMVLALLENHQAMGFVSSNAVGNIYYILRKAGGDEKARWFLKELMKYLTVIPMDHSHVVEALDSNFTDFEDALQNYTALRNQCECIVTRNTEDYKNSNLPVYAPLEFLHLFAF
ncbi:MAG: PIN domain-containing protein [Spirochaetales bacterium]|nr:PIN domain-containing protein [Spirochaetales bacterium]